MSTKKWYFTSIIQLLTLFIGTAIGITFMPEKVTVHLNILGQSDSVASKYLFIIYPLIALVIWGIMFLITKMFSKQDNKTNATIVTILTCLVMLLIMSIEVYFIIYIFSVSTIENISLYQVVNIVIGTIYIVMGLLLPKLSKNRYIGIRTSWSMYNDNTWVNSQKRGSLMLILVGIVTIAISIFIQSVGNLIVLAIGLIGIVGASLIITHNAYKEEIEKE